ncbi:hypothetical protein LR48_Vigan03g034600 [Vigna angularis]|uniref:Uncharacterized protein n=1 Tax=Phaseolus angularis TaxID=3914 RepID=A0A0L9U2G5_PHAAN|nr:hypothetical protein LR48_Vigan03g034600 [Vigna angularis]
MIPNNGRYTSVSDLAELTSIKVAQNISIELCIPGNGAPLTIIAAVADTYAMKPNSLRIVDKNKMGPDFG